MAQIYYEAFTTASVDGAPWYSVNCSSVVVDWLHENYILNKDFFVIRQIKGVWIDMPEPVFLAIILRW
jgi:hypothetical protein